MTFCLFMPAVAIFAFVISQWLRLENFLNGAREVQAQVSWLPGGEDFAHLYQQKDGVAMLRDKEFRRRHKFSLWVSVRQPNGQPLEVGVMTSKPMSHHKYGDSIDVLYNPDKPELVYLPGESHKAALIVLGVFGLFATFLPFLILAKDG